MPTTFSDDIVSETRAPHPRHDLRAFQLQHDCTMASTGVGDSMTAMKLYASKILSVLGDAQSELVGRAVVLTDGKAGTVENVWLDELHGLRISLRGHDGKWPISTLKFEQPTQDGSS